MNEKNFTHIDTNNNPTMVDVSFKEITNRIARAVCFISLPEIVLNQFNGDDITSPKGPVFKTAIVAGVMALKKTSDLIPFCHQLNIEGSKIEISIENKRAKIICTVKNTGKTGVEMEALMGANIAALTVYDMCKAFGHDMIISDCQLMMKSGGKNDFGTK